MTKTLCWSRWCAPWAVAFALAWGVTAGATEPYAAFLEGLKQRGMLDEAAAYLDLMADSPLIPTEQRARIPFEKAQLQFDRARAERDTTRRMKLLDETAAGFRTFAEANPTSPMLPSLRMQLGSILAERANTAVAQAEQPENAAKKPALYEQSQTWFTEALQEITAAEMDLLAKIKSLPEADAAVDGLRSDLIRARLMLGAVLFDQAKSLAADNPERKKLFEASAEKSNEVYTKYRSLFAALRGRLNEARAYIELGDTQKALGMLNEILVQPSEEPLVREVQSQALELAIPAWCSDQEKKYAEAAAAGRLWLSGAKSADARTPLALAVHYFTAVAIEQQLLHAQAGDALREDDLKVEARDLAQMASRYPNRHQLAARELFHRMRGERAADAKEPQSFAEAFSLAEEAMREMEGRYQQIQLAPKTGDSENVAQYEQESRRFGKEAQRFFRLALSLQTPEVEMEQVNSVRYYLSYVHYRQGNYYDAAILGEFLAHGYPQSSWGRKGAQLALASYLAEHNSTPEPNRGFDASRLESIATYAAKRWPGEPEADEAVMLLVELAVMDKRAGDAIKYLEQVPTASPRRGDAELKTGRALWAQYLATNRLEPGQRPPQTDLDQQAKQARELLVSGVARAAGGRASTELVAGAITLASIKLNEGDAAGALQELTKESSGPLMLAASNDPLLAQGNLKAETYRLGLRAYIAGQDFAKADEMLVLLEKEVAAGGDEAANERLTMALVSLGRELEQQITQLRESGRIDKIASISAGFENFLKRILAREQGNDFNSLNWVAGTFASLATGLDSGAGESSAEAKPYFQQAAEAYRLLVKKCDDGSFPATPQQRMAISVRLASVLRRLGQYEEAVDLLVNVLKKNNQLLDAQQEAAMALQAWGEKDEKYFDAAIRGHRQAKNKQGQIVPIVWGWAHLSRRVAGSEKYAEVYFDARYNLARCRLKQAMKLKQQGQSKAADESLARAAAEIGIQYRQTPSLGGAEWSGKFDSLLRTIQQAAGQPATGLPSEKPMAKNK
ncbi:MAG: tetratricopeptide repeat protein [Planctomycetia bacterium]|nr:tetratricopeptide repeat protein [Planctomycetia bacterium]